jgi:putative flippase GtrA
MATAVGYGQGFRSERRRARRDQIVARVRRFVRFGLVGLSGVLVNEAALAALVDIIHLNYLVGAVVATQCSTAWNFALVEWWAFDGADHRGGRARRFLMFWAVNMVALGLRGPILALLTSAFHIHYLLSNLISLGVLVVLRFAVADSLIWGRGDGAPAHSGGPDDLLAHFPRDVGEELGWAVNPVAEAVGVLAGDAEPDPGERATGPGPAAERRLDVRADELPPPPDIERPILLHALEAPGPVGIQLPFDPPEDELLPPPKARRYGSIVPPSATR